MSEACAQCGQDCCGTLTFGWDRKCYCAECWLPKIGGPMITFPAGSEAKSAAHGKDTTAALADTCRNMEHQIQPSPARARVHIEGRPTGTEWVPASDISPNHYLLVGANDDRRRPYDAILRRGCTLLQQGTVSLKFYIKEDDSTEWAHSVTGRGQLQEG